MSFLAKFTSQSHILRPLIRSFALSSKLFAERSATLYVGGLNWDTERDGLQTPFERFGHIKTTRLMTNRDTGRSRGFGYVEYENETDAQKALDSMHDSVIDGSRIRVDFAGPAAPRFVPTPTSTVYMGNLPQTLSGDELQDLLFEEFGDQIGIREIRLLAPRADSQGGGMSGFLSPSNQENFKNRGFGFIQFDSVDQSTQFLESVQAKMTGGWTFQGNVLRIGYEREKPPQRSMGGSPDRFGGGGGGNGGYNDRRAGGGMGDRNTYGSEGRERREFGGGRPTFGRQAGRRNSDY